MYTNQRRSSAETIDRVDVRLHRRSLFISISATDTTAITLSSFTSVYPLNSQPLTIATYYAPGGTWNDHASFFHDSAVSIVSLAYGFPYDDQCGTSTDISSNNPTKVTITLGWKDPLSS
jgi:hypothetical protein